MQKVKVHRYVSGKRPDYAGRSSSDEESEEDDFIVPARFKHEEEESVPHASESFEYFVLM